jgi:cystathionine beta-lyase
MKYDFDEVIARRGTGSFKWDAAEDPEVLPLWVADMDFRAAPEITAALETRVRHGIFGYAKVPPAYLEAVVRWFARRHGFSFGKEQLLPTTGVVPALAAIVRALCEPGDGVIVQPPVYNHFFPSIRGQGCEPLESNLVYREGRYTVDFADLEAKAKDPRAKLFLLCHPHNPVGRAWTAAELTRMGEICLANDVLVIADEIHCDLVYPGHRHVPFASLREDFLRRSITCSSPTKTFNLAGMQVANLLVADEALRRQVEAGLHANEIALVGPLGIAALVAAYEEGEAWLDALLGYLQENDRFLRGFFAEHLPELTVLPLEATYLVWVDCSALGLASTELGARLRERGKVWVNEGTLYGAAGEGFVRINIACPRSLLRDGLERLRSVAQPLRTSR